MKKVILLITIFASVQFSQDFDTQSLQDQILIGGDFGLTFTSSDYKDVGVGAMIRGVGEFYFYESNNQKHRVGVRGSGGYGISAGSDNRFDPDRFSTKLYTIAAGGVYSYKFSDVISPYVFAGLKYLRFNPKDSDGNVLPNNAAEEYDRNIFNLAFEFGLRYRLSDELFGYSSLTPINLTNDYIDDRASGSAKDFIVALNFGLLYKFTAPWSNDRYNLIDDDFPDGVETEYETEKVEVTVDTKNQKIEEEAEQEAFPEVEPEESVEVETKSETSKSNIVEELSHKLEFSKVNFKFGETELDRIQYVELDRLAKIIEENQKNRWKIVGYTDNIEPIQVHQSLAIQRAYFVLRYFMSKGIDRERFEVVVKGEENPIGDNSTEDGRAKNRRVEILKMN